MTTTLMWKSLDRGQTIGDKLPFPVPIIWNIKTQRMEFVLKRGQVCWAVQQFLLFIVFGIGCYSIDIIFILRSPTSDPLRREIVRSPSVLTARFLTTPVYFGGAAYLIGIFLLGKELVEIINALMKFEKYMKTEVRCTGPNRDFMGALMYTTTIVVPFIPPIAALQMIYKTLDPCYTVQQILLPFWLTSNIYFKATSTVLRFTLLTATGYEIARLVPMTCFGACFCVKMLNSSLDMLKLYYLNVKEELNATSKRSHFFIYKQLQLVLMSVNKSTSFPLFIAMMFNGLVAIVMSFIIVKHYDQANFIAIVASAVVLAATILLSNSLLPMSTWPNDTSKDLLRSWQLKPKVCGNRKYILKQLRSLKELYFYGGCNEYELYKIKRDIKVGYPYVVLCRILDALLGIQLK